MAEENKAETTQEVNNTETSSGEQVNDNQTEVKNYTQEDYQKAVEEATKEASNKAKRELSKTLGVNLFDEKETQSFIEGLSNKVDKSEIEKYQEQLKEYETLKQEKETLAFDNLIIKNGIKEEHSDRVKKLANIEVENGLTKEEAVKKVLDEFPMLKGTRKAGIDLNADNTNMSEAEKYLRDNYEYVDGKPVRRKK